MRADRPDPTRPPKPGTPREALGELEREQVHIEGRTFLIERPIDADRLLDHPAVRAELAARDYVPYWADLWPAARMLAKWIVKQPWTPGIRVLEVGCGLGLPGIAALSMGASVTFSDYDAMALEFAAANAKLNKQTNFDTLQLDWNYPPHGATWPLILAADLIYEEANVEPLVSLIQKLLSPAGVCWLTDQDRVPSRVLRELLAYRGLSFTTHMVRAGEPGGRRAKGTLYIIQLPQQAPS